MKHFIRETIKACQEVVVMLENHKDDKAAYEPQDIGAGGDRSVGLDLMAEQIFMDRLDYFGQINSEESGLVGEDNDVQIVLDPIDGSDNMLTLFPYFGASIAYMKNGKCLVGIVCNFANGDIYIKDAKQFLQGKLHSAHFKPVVKHHTSKIGIFEKAALYPELTTQLIENNLKYRAPGAVALSLAYAHNSNYMIFLGKMRTYDLEAGLYIYV
ncbi:inositol monophosphatase [Sulfurimonas sp. MAG313]|nr:inositol monophosphatase family protein [Sulfurimonas sp. MAG313]MDF1882042.1 inositol monophosphatase [Sulfurimonas sp. MAG313]